MLHEAHEELVIVSSPHSSMIVPGRTCTRDLCSTPQKHKLEASPPSVGARKLKPLQLTRRCCSQLSPLSVVLVTVKLVISVVPNGVLPKSNSMDEMTAIGAGWSRLRVRARSPVTAKPIWLIECCQQRGNR